MDIGKHEWQLDSSTPFCIHHSSPKVVLGRLHKQQRATFDKTPKLGLGPASLWYKHVNVSNVEHTVFPK